jgi:chemotaxis protein CheZ
MEHNYSRDQVVRVVSSLMDKVKPPQSAMMGDVYQELKSLSEIIEQMHEAIVDTHACSVNGERIPVATDELDAVVGDTERASASIMDACDVIQEAVSQAPEDIKNNVTDQTIKIFEACSFQDITGQRITKVVKSLKEIEGSVDRLIRLFGADGTAELSEKKKQNTQIDEDQSLMNGPQLEGQGVSQDDIDKLLAEFD